MLWEYNEHGVLGKYITAYRVRIFIPQCCFSCDHYDVGEFEDGYRLSGPFCYKNVFFPTRKGTCGKHSDPARR